MATKTDRITASDGKQYDLTYDYVPSTYTPAVYTPAAYEPSSWKLVSMTPVAVVVPPPPPPPNPSAGLITAFNGANSSSFKIDGRSVYVQNANKPHSLTSPDDHTLRFDLRSKDCWSVPGYSDATQNNGAERSEIQFGNNFGPGVLETLACQMEIAAGPLNTASWMVIGGQVHQVVSDGRLVPFAVEMVGEKMRIILRHNKTGPVTNITAWSDPNPVTRGKSYQMKYQIKCDPINGVANVWRDDVQIVNYAGPLGYPSQTYYWKLGVYREASAETTVATFRNISRV
jgi:hypothetical protein